MSRARTEKQAMEVKRMHEEQMEPIGENEHFEWDGLRRRRTVLESDSNAPSRSGTIVRRKTIHPPLGMTHFPADDSDDDTSYHPGFFQRLRSRGKSTNTAPSPSLGLATLVPVSSRDGAADNQSDKYKPDLQEDTSYKPHEPTIQFAPAPHLEDRQHSGSSLAPPRPPPHTAKRQFSFTNVFHRRRSDSPGADGKRPTSRSSRKSSRDHNVRGTEEERLGLVKGDSQVLLPIPSHDSRDLSPPNYSDWGMGMRSSPSGSPEREQPQRGVRRIDTEESLGEYEKDPEKSSGSGNSGPGAFL